MYYWCIYSLSWCNIFKIFSSSFQHVLLGYEFPKSSPKSLLWVRPESGAWVEGAAPFLHRTELNWDIQIWLSCLYMSEHFLVFQGVRNFILIHYYWVKGWTGLLPCPAGTVGDVWLPCLCWPLQPSTFLKDWTKILKVHTGTSEWCFWVMRPELWFWVIDPICDINLQCLLSYINGRLAPEWGHQAFSWCPFMSWYLIWAEIWKFGKPKDTLLPLNMTWDLFFRNLS